MANDDALTKREKRRVKLLFVDDDGQTQRQPQRQPQWQFMTVNRPTNYGAVGTGSSKSNNTSNSWRTSTATKSTRSTKPARQGIHTVRSGDTLWGIATSNGMSVKELLRRNPDLAKRKDNVIYAGDKINLTNIPTKESYMTPAKPKSAKPKAPTYSFKRKSGTPMGYKVSDKINADIRNGGGVRIPTGTIGLPGSDARVSLDQLVYE